jgi:hypothetical protein
VAKRIIRLSEEQSNNLNLMQNLLKEVATRGGCPTCTSGHPIEFQIESKELEQTFKVDNTDKLVAEP